MPSRKSVPGSSDEWFQRACGDLALASAHVPDGVFYEDLCFHAQQAAEKALKAVFVYYGLTFRYVHDLDELITQLKDKGLVVPENVEDAIELNTYAFESRYPGVAEPVSEEEYREALNMAQQVVDWAKLKLS